MSSGSEVVAAVAAVVTAVITAVVGAIVTAVVGAAAVDVTGSAAGPPVSPALQLAERRKVHPTIHVALLLTPSTLPT